MRIKEVRHCNLYLFRQIKVQRHFLSGCLCIPVDVELKMYKDFHCIKWKKKCTLSSSYKSVHCDLMDLAVYYELSKCFPSLLTWSASVKRICIWKSLIVLNQVFHANLSFWFFSNCLRTFVQERIPSTHRAWRGCSNHSWTEQKQKQERCFPCCWVSTGIFRNLHDPPLMRGKGF